MKLSRRLEKIVDLIQGQCLADIGCDHGYVVIEALLRHKVQKAYACDVAQRPLDNARRNIARYGLEDRASCLLMDGLALLPGDVDVIVMSGMGASLMIDILEQGKEQIKKGMHLYLSAHKDVSLLREYVSKNGLAIQKEVVVQEDGHFYPILELHCTKEVQKLTETQIFYGFQCVEDLDYRLYIEHEICKWKSILEKMPAHKNEEAQKRVTILEKL